MNKLQGFILWFCLIILAGCAEAVKDDGAGSDKKDETVCAPCMPSPTSSGEKCVSECIINQLLDLEFSGCSWMSLAFPTTHDRYSAVVPTPYQAEDALGLDPLIALDLYECKFVNHNNNDSGLIRWGMIIVKVDAPEEVASRNGSNFYLLEAFTNSRDLSSAFENADWPIHLASMQWSLRDYINSARIANSNISLEFLAPSPVQDPTNVLTESPRLHWMVGNEFRCADFKEEVILTSTPLEVILTHHGTQFDKLNPTPTNRIVGTIAYNEQKGMLQEECKVNT